MTVKLTFHISISLCLKLTKQSENDLHFLLDHIFPIIMMHALQTMEYQALVYSTDRITT